MNSGIENGEIPVFLRQKMAIYGQILAEFYSKNVIFEVVLTGTILD